MKEYVFDRPVLDPDKMEDWTYNGMKVYNFRRLINKNMEYVEIFDTEDYRTWGLAVPQEEWDDKMLAFAKEHGYI